MTDTVTRAIAMDLMMALHEEAAFARIDDAIRQGVCPFHALIRAPRRRRLRCPDCHPVGNPRPLAVDGHAYARRRNARRRRR